MKIASLPIRLGTAVAVGLATGCAVLATSGCDNPQRDVGSISISRSKQAAAENGIAGPGERDGGGGSVSGEAAGDRGGRGGR